MKASNELCTGYGMLEDRGERGLAPTARRFASRNDLDNLCTSICARNAQYIMFNRQCSAWSAVRPYGSSTVLAFN